APPIVGLRREREVLTVALDTGRHVAIEGPPGTRQVDAAAGHRRHAGKAVVFAEGNAELTPARLIMGRLGAAGRTWKLYGASSTQGGYVWSICPTFAECLDTSQHANLVPDAQFLAAASAGTLRSFSVVTPRRPRPGHR